MKGIRLPSVPGSDIWYLGGLTQPLSTDRGKRATRSDSHKQHPSLHLCSQLQRP